MDDAPSHSGYGPQGWRNWRSFAQGDPLRGRAEFMLYSDAPFVGHLPSVGPYALLNTIARARQVVNGCRPGLILRIDNHLADQTDITHATRTDVSAYHGGEMDDELAAVVGLVLGRRLRSGGLVRRFDGDDPLGMPLEALHEPPVLAPPSARHGGVLPALSHEADLQEALAPLLRYPGLGAAEAVALARAARLYQDALWVADVDPHLSWVLLVSAVEAVAAAGAAGEQDDEAEMYLRKAKPTLFAILDQPSQEGLRAAVVDAFGDTVGSTRRFVRFLLAHLPEQPPNGPSTTFRIKWTSRGLADDLRTIYDYRSRALHAGLPFPEPMCSPPFQLDDGTLEEKPSGLAAWAKSGTWMAKDLPMLLHVFSYIVRGSLLGWLATTAPSTTPPRRPPLGSPGATAPA